jgi:hypothetical protein
MLLCIGTTTQSDRRRAMGGGTGSLDCTLSPSITLSPFSNFFGCGEDLWRIFLDVKQSFCLHVKCPLYLPLLTFFFLEIITLGL